MEIPPPIEPAKPPLLPTVKRWRWGVHLGLLVAYPLALGILPGLASRSPERTLLPKTVNGLIEVSIGELLIFGLVFLLAWSASRASSSQLKLGWNGSGKPVLFGALYSIALRIAVSAILTAAVVAAAVLSGAGAKVVEKVRPHTEVVVDPNALVHNPVYLWMMLTLISFVVAGLREEIWRSGVLAGLEGLWPARFQGTGGQLAGVAIAAIIFGLGHLPQGWGGAGATAVLGFGLGWIMVYHKSIWEAVFAHGFFNATSFAMLYWLARYYPNLMPGHSQ